MQRKVLLVYRYYHHHGMVERLASGVEPSGVGVDTLCSDNYVLNSRTGVRLPVWARALMGLLRSSDVLCRSRFSRSLFRNRIFPAIARRYDLIDFHVFTMDRLPLMKACMAQGIPYDIAPWGSDVLRPGPEESAQMESGFAGCRCIKGSRNLLDAISSRYEGRFNMKMREVYFGQNDFCTIDSLSGEAVSAFRSSLPAGPDDCIIACGYNSYRAQQHIRIIKCLASLPDDVKSKIVLLLQMTYPSDPEYVDEVRTAAAESGLRFRIFDRFLGAEEVASIRVLSDIAVNMQITDAFSGSLQGHLYAGGILIAGEWLRYPVLEDNGIFYLKVSFDSLTGTVADVIARKEYYKSKCSGNHDAIGALTSWPAVIGAWIDSYND